MKTNEILIQLREQMSELKEGHKNNYEILEKMEVHMGVLNGRTAKVEEKSIHNEEGLKSIKWVLSSIGILLVIAEVAVRFIKL